MKKKLLVFLLSASMVFSGMPAGVMAAEDTHTETAETMDVIPEEITDQADATKLTLNEAKAGKLTAVNTPDVYSFTLEKDGNIELYFANDENIWTLGWNVELSRSADFGKDDIINTYTLLNRKNPNDEIMLNRMGLPAGTWYLRVNTEVKTFLEYNYYLRVKYNESEYWEKETDTASSPVLTELGKDYYGTIFKENDTDYYKFELPSDGNVKIAFGNDYAAWSGTGWTFQLYTDPDFSEEVIKRNIAFENKEDYVISNMGLAKGTYYAKVSGKDISYRSVGGADYRYHFKVTHTPSAVWEIEPDSQKSPKAISINTAIYGTCNGSNDIDYYSFDLSSAKKVTLQFDTIKNDFGGAALYNVFLYGAEGYLTSELAKVVIPCGLSETFTSDLGKLAAGKYFVKVTTNTAVQDKDYDFVISTGKTDDSSETISAPVVAGTIDFDSKDINKGSIDATVGKNVDIKLDITGTDKNEMKVDASVCAISSAPSVATVSQSGDKLIITPVAAGTSFVSVCMGNKTKTVKVVVSAPVKTLDASANNVSLSVGKKYAVALIPGAVTTDSFTWESKDPAVCAVDKNGVLTGKKEGSTVITAKASSGVETKINVYVTAKTNVKNAVEKGSLNYIGNDRLIVGEMAFVSTTLPVPADGNGYKNAKISYKVSGTGKVKIDKAGRVMATKAGKVTITAKCGKAELGRKDIIVDQPLKLAKLNKATVSVKLGNKDSKDVTLKLALNPSIKAYDKLSQKMDIVWKTDDSSVTAKADNAKGRCTFTVKNKGITKVTATVTDPVTGASYNVSTFIVTN
ncbi:MAG: Ig-like domain-containing protein [Lachnospiraceae bacterium]|nr:Ig-like domain-containing protein [Lachnospiraceae bacterium]